MGDDIDSYVCSLPENIARQAEKELNEIPKERLAALKSFRDWVLQQRNWLKCPTDAHHLLMFLRNKKFVQLKAREKLVQYWTARTHNPRWLTNLDPCDPTMEKIFKQGLFIPISGFDPQGRKFGVSRWGVIDASGKSYEIEDVVKAVALFNEFLMIDEQTQVTGFLVFEDFTGFGVKHSAFFGLDLPAKMAKVFTKAIPLRFKGFHQYNNNPVFEALLSAIKPFMSKKVFDRMHLHGKSLTTIYKHIDKSMLPVEYLPDDYNGPNSGTIPELIEKTITEIQKPEVRDYLLRISSTEYGVDEQKKPPDSELFCESFRKLQID